MCFSVLGAGSLTSKRRQIWLLVGALFLLFLAPRQLPPCGVFPQQRRSFALFSKGPDPLNGTHPPDSLNPNVLPMPPSSHLHIVTLRGLEFNV